MTKYLHYKYVFKFVRPIVCAYSKEIIHALNPQYFKEQRGSLDKFPQWIIPDGEGMQI